MLRNFKRFSTKARCIGLSQHGNPLQVLRVHEYPTPQLSDDFSVLVKVLAAAINPADINQIEGVYPIKLSFSNDLGTPEPIAIPGGEGLVEVLDIGSGVVNFQKGDWAVLRNTGFGTWRTHAIARQDQLLKIPKNGLAPHQIATATINPSSAYRMLKDYVSLKKGEWFIQNGANSSVGQMAIQLGKLWGYRSINVIRHRPDVDKLKDYLKSLGADHVITDEELSNRDIKSKIPEWTNNKGVLLGLNGVGGKIATDMARQLSNGGKLVTYGGMSRQPVIVPTGLFIFQNISCHGFWLSAWRREHEREQDEMILEILKHLENGSLKSVPCELIKWTEDSTPEESLEVCLSAIGRFRKGFGGQKQVLVM